MFHCLKWQHIFNSNTVPASNDGTMKHNFSWCSTGSTSLTCCVKQEKFTNIWPRRPQQDFIMPPNIMLHRHPHCPTYCVISASENWRSLTENFASVGAVWLSVEPNISWKYEVLLWSSRSDIYKLLCFTQNLCFIVPSFESGTNYYWKCVVILYGGTFEMAFV